MSKSNTADFDYDSIPIGYYDNIYRLKSGMQSKWHHLKFRKVLSEFPVSCSHLDVACGPGTFIGNLPATITSTGVDIASNQINYAKSNYSQSNVDFKLISPGNLPFKDASFDIVTSIELIEHISPEETKILLKECLRVLKPKGKLIITTPNYGAFWPILEIVLNRVSKLSYKEQHITKYKNSILRQILSESGFPSINVKSFMFSAPFSAALNWRLADIVDSAEPGIIVNNFGHLLLGVATKL
jgi:SAM-dependent methyltransferase